MSAKVSGLYDGNGAVCRQVDLDRYGRIVARCSVDGRDVGEDLVSRGLAFAYRAYSMKYDLVEKGAAINDRGLHASRVQNPAAYRVERSEGSRPPRPNCAIGGNITKSGRIYHMPGQHDY